MLPFPQVRGEVEALLEDLVRPLVEADGGGIELVAVDGNVVTVRLTRACGGCPGAPYTRAGLIEPVLRRALGPRVVVRLERAATRPSSPEERRASVADEG